MVKTIRISDELYEKLRILQLIHKKKYIYNLLEHFVEKDGSINSLTIEEMKSILESGDKRYRLWQCNFIKGLCNQRIKELNEKKSQTTIPKEIQEIDNKLYEYYRFIEFIDELIEYKKKYLRKKE